MGVIKDLKGLKFGLLIPIKYISKPPKKGKWLCKCECGNEKEITTSSITSGKTKSCGCLSSRHTVGERRTTHGRSSRNNRCPEYAAWNAMKTRCDDSNREYYKNYGGRGIAVCDRWKDSFEFFFADMGLRPSSDHSLDRYPNNNGNYEPNNCRWATRAEQRRNQRDAFIVEYKGSKKPLADFCEDLSISYKLVWGRLKKGWPLQMALETIPIIGSNQTTFKSKSNFISYSFGHLN